MQRLDMGLPQARRAALVVFGKGKQVAAGMVKTPEPMTEALVVFGKGKQVAAASGQRVADWAGRGLVEFEKGKQVAEPPHHPR